MEELFIKSRNTGRFLSMILSMEGQLKLGGSVFVASLTENGYIQMIMDALNSHGIRNAKYIRVTRKEPSDNLQLIFNGYGEPLGVDILEQTDKFVGWKVYTD